jgi:hypothetical protein
MICSGLKMSGENRGFFSCAQHLSYNYDVVARTSGSWKKVGICRREPISASIVSEKDTEDNKCGDRRYTRLVGNTCHAAETLSIVVADRGLFAADAKLRRFPAILRCAVHRLLGISAISNAVA